MKDPFFLFINKPAGPSSQDLLRKIKKLTGKSVKKLGHLGTLDPFADGLLIVGGNGACRLDPWILKLKKSYQAVGVLGEERDTGDRTGKVKEVKSVPPLEDGLEEKLQRHFIGEYWQAPHQYSAAKFEGRPLYQYAREGVKIEKEKKKRHIFGLGPLSFKGQEVTFSCEVSSGTYIRTLFEDIAKLMGTLGHLKSLKRTAIGQVHLDQAFSLEEVNSLEELEARAVSCHEMLSFPSLDLSENEGKKYSHGMRIKLNREGPAGETWVFEKAKLLGLASIKGSELIPKLNFCS